MPEPARAVAKTANVLICGAGDDTGEHACMLSPNHGPIHAPSGQIFDHANPRADAWWNEAPTCGAEHPDHPGLFACAAAPGHGPIPGLGRAYDHADPLRGVWWHNAASDPKDPDPLIGVRRVLLEALLDRYGLSAEMLKVAHTLVGAVLDAEGKE